MVFNLQKEGVGKAVPIRVNAHCRRNPLRGVVRPKRKTVKKIRYRRTGYHDSSKYGNIQTSKSRKRHAFQKSDRL